MAVVRLCLLAALLVFVAGLIINNRAVIFAGMLAFIVTLLSLGAYGWITTKQPLYKSLVLWMGTFLLLSIIGVIMGLRHTLSTSAEQALVSGGSLLYLVSLLGGKFLARRAGAKK